MTTDTKSIECTKNASHAKHAGADTLSANVWQEMQEEKGRNKGAVTLKPHHEIGPVKSEDPKDPKDGIKQKIDHLFSSKEAHGSKITNEFPEKETNDFDFRTNEKPLQKWTNSDGTSHPINKKVEEPQLPKDVEAALRKILSKYGHSEHPVHSSPQKPGETSVHPIQHLYPSDKPIGPVTKPSGDKSGDWHTPKTGETSPALKPIKIPHIPLTGPASSNPYETSTNPR